MFQLAGAFGAFADHRRHDRAGDLRGAGALLFAEGARGIGMAFMMHSDTACSGEVSRRSLNQTACVPVTLFKL